MVQTSLAVLATMATAQELFISRPDSGCIDGPCYPGNEFCGEPFQNAPQFHLMDQHGCGENDPNGPVFDPVHGVIHHFYQIHLAAAPGHGPDYGHFVSKDFVHWAALPVAIWNGLDSSVWPPRVTAYDNEAIFTGSGVVVDGAGPNGQPGVVQIYPGLCNKNDWPGCETGTLLAQAVPANYETDQLLVNWTKPSYNPIVENTQRDPSTPWKTASGEWRLRTYDSMVYGAASDADLLAGKWYTVGRSGDFRQCECPSVYPLPASTPGWEDYYEQDGLPTHVHKTSCGGDWWQLGTYTEGAPKELGSFKETEGWEDLFQQKKMDVGQFYASKDNEYPSKGGGKRRINWGWATVPPASTQTLPREITFNAATRTLEQAPIEELESLRGEAAYSRTGIKLVAGASEDLKVAGIAKQSEVVATFELPSAEGKFSIVIGDGSAPAAVHVTREMTGTDMPGNDYNITHHPKDTDPKVCQAACDADDQCDSWTYVIRGEPAGSGDCCLKKGSPCPRSQGTCTSGSKVEKDLEACGSSTSTVVCEVDYAPPTYSSKYYEVPVSCGGKKDTLRLMPSEKTLEVRVFSDWTFIEAFFQKGRVAMVVNNAMNDQTDISLSATVPITAAATAFPMKSIWVDSEAVREAPRVYK